MGSILRVHETIQIWRKGKKVLNEVLVDRLEFLLDNDELLIITDNIKRIFGDLKNLKTGNDFEQWKSEMKVRKTKHCITTSANNLSGNPYAAVLKSYQVGKKLNSVLKINTEHYQMEHPTQKPVILLQHLINLCSSESEIIFDPFLGSGTTAIACLNTNRKFLGCEIDKEYFEIATKRIENQKKINKSKLF
jgi:site-specific DNA-methyltransferase (adenine-specific)